ncbi:hypothetical protein DFR29_101171 [Tahibacter aquaticus]|uniref:Uncharacterized protein n=1 Tax=Tahibacter aquaticus TaxID=520092 RepID=A0A4R6Z9G9_9GAMM|nr:hypothetical protein [Tahibacter aquaticus]TDR48551.1 hypothetical protein DFR29_101171 [Tahibacter aquaticus]
MRRPVLALALAALFAAGGSAFLATTTTAQAASNAPADMAAAQDGPQAAPHRGQRHGRGNFAGRQGGGPVAMAMRDLRALERLYLLDGRGKDIEGLYRDVLARTQNPAIRQFAYGRIARNELKPADAGKAITTLRQSLDENLKRLPQ